MSWLKPSDDPNAIPWPTRKPHEVDSMTVMLPVTVDGMESIRSKANDLNLITARAVDINRHPLSAPGPPDDLRPEDPGPLDALSRVVTVRCLALLSTLIFY